jgi:hypothetical protein
MVAVLACVLVKLVLNVAAVISFAISVVSARVQAVGVS